MDVVALGELLIDFTCVSTDAYCAELRHDCVSTVHVHEHVGNVFLFPSEDRNFFVKLIPW